MTREDAEEMVDDLTQAMREAEFHFWREKYMAAANEAKERVIFALMMGGDG